MVIDFQAMTQRVTQWIAPFLKKEEPPAVNGVCCIELCEDTLTFIALNTLADTPDVRFMQMLSMNTLTDAGFALKALVEKQGLEKTPTHWLLSPSDYQLFMIESMPVPEAEMRAALRWRVRSLITQPIEDVVIDYFTLPAKKNSPNHPMIAAVVVKKATSLAISQAVKMSGLSLTHFDIPELAMARLTAMYETDEKATAFFYITGNTVIMNISAEKSLYFTRQLLLERDANNHINHETLCLEIKRYLDFFRSQWRYAIPTRLYVACKDQDTAIIAKGLSDHLLTPVLPFPTEASRVHAYDLQTMNPYLLNLGCMSHSVQPSQTLHLLNELRLPTNMKPLLDFGLFLKANAFIILCLALYGIMLRFEVHQISKQLIADTEQNKKIKQAFLAAKKTYPALFLAASVDESLQTQKIQLDTQKRIISILEKRTPFSEDLISIGNAITPEVWLTEIRITDYGDTLFLTGNSLSMEALPSFTVSLPKQSVFAEDIIHLQSVNTANNKEKTATPIVFTLQIEHSHHANKL